MYSDIVADIKAALRTVTALKVVLDYEPRSVGANPLAYLMLTAMERSQPGTAVEVTYHTLVRVAIAFRESDAAEAVLWPLVNSIPAALEPRGHGVETALAQFVQIPEGGTEYRALDFSVKSYEVLGEGES